MLPELHNMELSEYAFYRTTINQDEDEMLPELHNMKMK